MWKRRRIINIKAVAKLPAFHILGMKTTVSFDILVSTKLKGSYNLDKLGICDI